VMRIGIDFDNTLIRYDDVFRQVAQQRGLVAPDFPGSKQKIRDAIRCQHDGELKWQALQGYVYGKGIGGATLFPGVADFLRRARALDDTVMIVSHKTEHGHFDPDKVNLREAAMGWMEGQGFFTDRGFSMSPSHVHFASSRPEKLARIAELKCDIFVDDLAEVLVDANFPGFVRRILFSERAEVPSGAPYQVCRDWRAVGEIIFLDRG
jgi:hypothetical protein